MNPVDDDELMTVHGLDLTCFFPLDDESIYDGSVCGWDGVDGGEEDDE